MKPEISKELLTFCQGTRVFVEATNFERHALWVFFSIEFMGTIRHAKTDIVNCSDRVRWKDHSQGTSIHIGRRLGRPIMLGFTRAEIGGSRVIFFSPESTMVDWTLVNQYVAAIQEKLGTKPKMVNAENFNLNILR